MRIRSCFALVVVVSFVSMYMSAPAQSQGLLTDCAQEINAHCSNVTAGDGRVVACLIAYEDRISPECRLTAYLGAGEVGKRRTVLAELYKICVPFVRAHCMNVTPGGGRIYRCLRKNFSRIGGECRTKMPEFESKFLQ